MNEFRRTWARGPFWLTHGKRPLVSFTQTLAETHERNCRRYAEVMTRVRHFYFAPQVLLLPAPQRLGLLAHEIGHCLVPRGSEDDADEAAEEQLGIRISYDLRWSGKGLQTGKILW